MTIFLAGARFQALLLRRSPAELMALFTVPFFSLAFAAIVIHAGRADLAPYAVLGPAVIAIWGMALNVSGDIIDSERFNATFEATLATPASVALLILGRVSTVTLVSLISIPESAGIAWAAFGVRLRLADPALFAVTLLLTAIATVGAASSFASLFVLARSARTFQNSLSYPFYILSGAVVPISLLPGWLQPATKIVFLSWSASLLRHALTGSSMSGQGFALAALTLLGVLSYVTSYWLMTVVLRRTRIAGTTDRA